jgi:hypothetical protein
MHRHSFQEISVRPKNGVLLLLVFLSIAIGSSATTLPDSCGSDNVQFDVKTQKHPPAPAAPAQGKAQIVFLEAMDRNLGCWTCGSPTSRIGMDGAWVGANQGNSWFAIDVAPGEHHLCTDWQSAFGTLKKKIGMAEFTAEAGKTYYFEVKVKIKEVGSGNSSDVDRDLDFAQISDDEGKFRMQSAALATSAPRK